LFETAHVLITCVATCLKLKASEVGVAKLRGAKRAKVAPARKIGIILDRMWIEGGDFRFTAKDRSATKRQPCEFRHGGKSAGNVAEGSR
jgi:transposase